MINFLLNSIKWINKNKLSAYILYLVLPFVSFYLNINKNYSWDLITILLILVFILRVIVGIIVSINLVSNKHFEYTKHNRSKIKTSVGIFSIKFIVGILIIIAPLFVSNNFAHNYIEEKLQNETKLEKAKIYDLIYPHKRGHLSGAMGYEYEFYINNIKYKGRHLGEKRKIGEFIEIKYNAENPWLNKKNE